MCILLDSFVVKSYLEINFKFLRECMKLERCLNGSKKKASGLMVVYQIKKGVFSESSIWHNL